MKDAGLVDLDIAKAKPRPRGTLPYLPGDRDPDLLRGWLTRAVRPESGWSVADFDRTGRDPADPCTLHIKNGRDSRSYRFRAQRDLFKTPRTTIATVTDGWLDVPHLTGGEIEDLCVALCRLGAVLTEYDERYETRKSVEQLLVGTAPMHGHTLLPDGRYDALVAIKAQGEFTKPDAMSMLRPGDDRWQRRPIRFVDKDTGEQWVRMGEAATYLRWVLGVEPLSHSTLRSKLQEIGVVARHFQDYRPPHPKAWLYQLTEELIETVDGGAEA
jgi:hypothetical protein